MLSSSNSRRVLPTIELTVRGPVLRRVFLLALAGLIVPAAAHAGRVTPVRFLSAVTTLVNDLAPRSAFDAAAIRESYRPYIEPLVLDDFAQIETGLVTGGLVPLPLDLERFNVRVRLEGRSPIGEKDIAHQASYVAARTAAIGCLLDIASQVKSGPIEVTSLVRHLGYQHELLMTNANALTDVPTHALGIAFDIAMVNTPLETVLEIRDVLRKMSDAGDIFVIAERQQLVFHVVPQPARLGWYADVYARAMTGQPWTQPADDRIAVVPVVTTSINSVQRLPQWAAEWWAADNAPVDLPIAVRPDLPRRDVMADADGGSGMTGGYLALVGELLSSAWHSVAMTGWSMD